jgi:hypothetical protein
VQNILHAKIALPSATGTKELRATAYILLSGMDALNFGVEEEKPMSAIARST